MADILGAVSAASALLEQAISIIGRIRTANEREKGLVAELQSHNAVLESTKAIIELIRAEASLRTAAVRRFLTDVNVAMSNLVRLLKTLNPGEQGQIHRFFHQLVDGSKDEKALADMMQKLDRAKAALGICLQVSSVGLRQTPDSSFVANVEMIKRISTLLEQALGAGNGLKIAELIQNRAQHDGNVPLDNNDIEVLNKEGGASRSGSEYSTVEDEGRIGTSRIVVDNLTEDQARMINGPIGEDVWKRVSHLEIRWNTAKGKSEMVNHGMTLDTLKKIRAETRLDHEKNHRIFMQQAGVILIFVVVAWILVKFW